MASCILILPDTLDVVDLTDLTELHLSEDEQELFDEMARTAPYVVVIGTDPNKRIIGGYPDPIVPEDVVPFLSAVYTASLESLDFGDQFPAGTFKFFADEMAEGKCITCAERFECAFAKLRIH